MSTWPDSYISANGITLHYYRTGGEKTPIVLLHGFTDNALCWTRTARVLEQEYDVIMVDARGHGLSEGPTTGFSAQLLADDVVAFIQALHLERPFLLGHSMGAATAAVVAAQQQELVRAIVLEDPPWSDRVSTANASEEDRLQEPSAHPWYKRVAALKAQTPEERIKTAHEVNPDWAEEELGFWIDSKEQFNLNTFRYSMPGVDWHEIVPKIRCPLLLITGEPEKGAIVTPEVAREASQLWRDGQVIHIAEAGHNIRRVQFAHYQEAITTFLKGH
jgi:pimeloyl-ACP methyl ester carboxylesterase